METHLLSEILFLPLVGACILAFLRKDRHVQVVGIAVSVLTFFLSLWMWYRFDPSLASMQLVESYEWIPDFGIRYYLGVDGLSLYLVLLTTFLSPVVLLSGVVQVERRVKEYYITYLVLETGMLGAFMALDLFLFYIFWEAMLIPMYFIIGIWGGERRIYATVKFFIYTMFGSLLMLLAILYLGIHGGTFDLVNLSEYTPGLGLNLQLWLFAAFAISFAIKVPTVPFHTWLPDAHVEAPTGGSVILAGVLLKMGVYGFLRFCFPLFPQAVEVMAPWMCLIGVVGIIYGALLAYAQEDLKKLVAYSSISHLGFVVLGIFSLTRQGISGGIYQMLNHGISTGALFLLVGVIYQRRHTRRISDFGGIASRVPVFATILLIVTLSSIGLPGLNGFVGEFLILLGSFQSRPLFAVLGCLGVVLGAIYMLSMYRRVAFGRVLHRENEDLRDMNKVEKWSLIPLVILIFVMGLAPQIFLRQIDLASGKILSRVRVSQDLAKGR